MAVAGHDGQVLRRQVEVDAVHHGAQLVLSRCEERAVDILGQHGGGDIDDGGTLANLLRLGELVGILNGEGEHTVLIADLGDVGALVDVEADGLLADALDGLQQVVVAHTEASVAIVLVELNRCFHHHLAVGCGQVETSVDDFK